MQKPNVTTAAEAARMKGVTAQAILNALKSGRLNGTQAGRNRFVFLDEAFETYRPQHTGGRAHRAYKASEG